VRLAFFIRKVGPEGGKDPGCLFLGHLLASRGGCRIAPHCEMQPRSQALSKSSAITMTSTMRT
jgi:hypothetical protein